MRSSWWCNLNVCYISNVGNLHNLRELLYYELGLWQNSFIYTYNSSNVTAHFSGRNRANLASQNLLGGLGTYSYFTATLADILSKRDNLYQSLARSKSTSLDFSFYNSFNNKFFTEIHSILPYIHTDLPSVGASRSLLFSQLTTSLGGFEAFLGGGLFSNLQNYEQLTHSFRSQYKPMRRGITNMVRLQATNAIAMPTEIRLHILASSKDVIHS